MVSFPIISQLKILPLFSDWDQQLSFLSATLLHPTILQYPPKWSYQIAFLKQCIHVLESVAEDIRDEFYELLVSLQEKESTWPQKWVYRHYLLPESEEIVTVTEAPQIISEGTTGLSCWQAGIFLADWITQNPQVLQDKRVLELGSGTGATGLIINKSSKPPQELVLSDCHENVLRLLNDNVALNGCQGVRVINLNWDDISHLDEVSVDPEVVLAADVVYDDTIFRPLVDVLLSLWRRRNSILIYLAATVRNEDTLRGFLKMVDETQVLRSEEICNSNQLRNSLNWDDRTEIKLFLIKGGVASEQQSREAL